MVANILHLMKKAKRKPESSQPRLLREKHKKSFLQGDALGALNEIEDQATMERGNQPGLIEFTI